MGREKLLQVRTRILPQLAPLVGRHTEAVKQLYESVRFSRVAK